MELIKVIVLLINIIWCLKTLLPHKLIAFINLIFWSVLNKVKNNLLVVFILNKKSLDILINSFLKK